jgi:hypothetical protein
MTHLCFYDTDEKLCIVNMKWNICLSLKGSIQYLYKCETWILLKYKSTDLFLTCKNNSKRYLKEYKKSWELQENVWKRRVGTHLTY